MSVSKQARNQASKNASKQGKQEGKLEGKTAGRNLLDSNLPESKKFLSRFFMSRPCVTNLELKSKDHRGLVFQVQKGDRWNIPCTQFDGKRLLSRGLSGV